MATRTSQSPARRLIPPWDVIAYMSPQLPTGRRVGLLLMFLGVAAGLLVVVNAVAVSNGLWRVPTDLLLVGVALGLVAYPAGYAIREGVTLEAVVGDERFDGRVVQRFRRSDR